MIFTYKIQEAIRFAVKTHEVYQKQKRKGKDIPYITHPLTVGLILASAGTREEVIIAGILHDTIEDSVPEKKVSPEMLEKRFGKEVAELVVSVSEMNKELPWEVRKSEALEHLKNFSRNSLLVKSADIISNATELLTDYANGGEQVFARFNASKEKVLKHYLEFILIMLVECWSENPLASDLKNIADSIAKIGRKTNKPVPRIGNETITEQNLVDKLRRLFWVDAIIQLEAQIQNKDKKGKWRLEGWDTFSMESYPLEGEYNNEEEAREAAQKYLAELQESQPTASSGGQDGIQDQVYIYGPDGSGYRFRGQQK